MLAKNMIKCYIIEEVVDRILGGLGGIFPKKPKNFKMEIAILRKTKKGHNNIITIHMSYHNSCK